MNAIYFSEILLFFCFSGVLSLRITRDVEIYSEEDGSDEILVEAATVLPTEMNDIITNQLKITTLAETDDNTNVQTKKPSPPETNDVTAQPEEPGGTLQPEKPEITIQTEEPEKTVQCEELKTTAQPVEQETTVQTVKPFDPRVRGINIGLSAVLLDLNRRLVFTRRVPLESVIKVLVLSSKIERLGGEVNELNRDMMKILPPLLPEAFKAATCTSF